MIERLVKKRLEYILQHQKDWGPFQKKKISIRMKKEMKQK